MGHKLIDLSTEQIKQMIALFAQNMSNKDVATYFGIHQRALRNWIHRRTNAEIRQRIEQAKVMAKAKMREAVFRKGVGQPYRQGRPQVIQDGKVVDEGQADQTAIPGDLTAAKYWQANNDEWNDVSKTELSGPDGKPISLQVPNMSTRELASYVVQAIRDGVVKLDGLPKPKPPQRAEVRAIDADFTETE